MICRRLAAALAIVMLVGACDMVSHETGEAVSRDGRAEQANGTARS